MPCSRYKSQMPSMTSLRTFAVPFTGSWIQKRNSRLTALSANSFSKQVGLGVLENPGHRTGSINRETHCEVYVGTV